MKEFKAGGILCIDRQVSKIISDARHSRLHPRAGSAFTSWQHIENMEYIARPVSVIRQYLARERRRLTDKGVVVPRMVLSGKLPTSTFDWGTFGPTIITPARIIDQHALSEVEESSKARLRTQFHRIPEAAPPEWFPEYQTMFLRWSKSVQPVLRDDTLA